MVASGSLHLRARRNDNDEAINAGGLNRNRGGHPFAQIVQRAVLQVDVTRAIRPDELVQA